MNLEKNCCKYSEVVCEIANEKLVECDFIVPDYYPDILKIMHTEAIPRIKSKYVKEDKYIVEGYVDFKIFYTSQELCKLICVSTSCDFQTSFDLKQVDENSYIKVKTDVMNVMSRAISERKVSPKATINIAIKCWNDSNIDIAIPCDSKQLEQKKSSIDMFNIISSKAKAIAISEDIEISNSTSQVQSIIKSDAKVSVSDIKTLINKVVIHGFAIVKNIYIGIDDSVEEIESKIPFTQIVEMDDVDENAQIDTSFDVTEIMCSLKQTDTGENRIISLDLELMANIRCFKNIQTILLEDAFSLNNNASFETKNIKYDKLMNVSTDSFMDKITLELEYDIKKVEYSSNSVRIISFETNGGKVIANMEFVICVLLLNAEDEITNFKKTITFKMDITCDNTMDNLKFDSTADLVNWSYNITSDNTIDIRYEVVVNSIIIERSNKSVITNITIDEDSIKENKKIAPVTIYYAKKGEAIWDIAKKYNTVFEEVKTVNDIFSDELETDAMLIIPKVKYAK